MGKRLISRLAAATAGTAAFVLAAPGVALANSVTVSPTTVAPGGKITIHVTCTKSHDHRVEVFWGRDVDRPEAKQDVRLRDGSGSATFTIPFGTRPSHHVAGTKCPGDSHPIVAHFTVAPRGAPESGGGPGGSGGGATLAGAGVLAVATAAGAFLLMRRRVDGPVG